MNAAKILSIMIPITVTPINSNSVLSVISGSFKILWNNTTAVKNPIAVVIARNALSLLNGLQDLITPKIPSIPTVKYMSSAVCSLSLGNINDVAPIIRQHSVMAMALGAAFFKAVGRNFPFIFVSLGSKEMKNAG